MNSKLHTVCDSEGRPRTLLLTAVQVSDYTGAAALLSSLPPAKALLADKGHDADRFRDALAERKVVACIPSKLQRKIHIPNDKALYRNRRKLENMFGKLKDWRRIHTRYDRCAHTFMSAIAIVAIVIFWIRSTSPEPSTQAQNPRRAHAL
ncbi:Transposase [Jannaschia rubra]|uniref:Transposase n=1 Tax=Jannaschia rubra TaxID=282197 RepID=A0A0M6XT50_9RHOB|nr:Transposase [Jannaschia rubra]SFG17737.1 Transposase DDE domain-containing protein [Jannaschia rubra]